MKPRHALVLVGLIAFSGLLAGCAPGDARFNPGDLAGFWWGIWHGAISPITLVVGIFSDAVHVYERANTGGWYDAGFLFGVVTIWGAGGRGGEHTWRRSRRDRDEERRNREEWEEVGRKVEAKLKTRLRDWADAEPDENWDDVERKLEEKARKVVRDWADED